MSAQDRTILIDAKGKVIAASRGTSRLARVKAGSDWHAAFPGELAERYDAKVRKSMRLGEQVSFLHESGSRILEFTAVPFIGRNGKVDRAALLLKDVTAREKARKECLQQGERLEFALSATKDGLWDWDLSTGALYWNPCFYAMLGYKPGEIEPSYKQWQKLCYPEDLPVVEKALQRHLAGKTDSFEAEYRIRQKKGRMRWLLARGKVQQRDSSGVPLRMVGMHIDITERKDFERSLQESEEKFRSLFSTMSEGVAIHEVIYGKGGEPQNYRILDVNPGYEKIVGLPRERVVGKLATEVYGTALPPYLEVFARVARTGRPEHLETYFPPHKKHYWITISSSEAGKFNTIFLDISVERNAIEALKESEERFRQLAENIQEVMWIVTPDWGKVVYLSPTFKKVWQRDPEEAYKDPGVWFDAVVAEDRKALVEALERKRQGDFKDPSFPEYRIRRPDNTIRWIFARAYPVFDPKGKVMRVAGIAEDITERKHAVAVLEAKEQAFRTLVENVPGVVYRCDVQSPWMMGYMSDGVQEICGHSAAEFMGNRLAYADIVYPEDLPGVEKEIADAVASHKIYELEYRVLHTSGTIHWVHEKGQAIYDGNNQPQYLEGVILDITGRKNAETGLLVSLQEKETLLQEVNHRVKNNLQLIMSLFNLQLARSPEGESARTLREALGRIKSIALVHEKLFQSEQVASIDIRSYIQGLVENISHSLGGDGGQVSVRINVEKFAEFDIDKAIPCGLIVNELVTNAFKHAFPNGRKGSVAVELAGRGKGCIVLSVRDDGIGLPGDIQIDSVKTLGLRLVSTLAKSVGEIEVDRAAGTAFSITFKDQ